MDFRLPEIAEGVREAELVAWRVAPGAAVARGAPLADVMTDKATLEICSPFAGTVAELRAAPGNVLKVGDVLLAYTAADPDNPTPPAHPRLADPASVHAAPPPPETARPRAAPAVRRLARAQGIDLAAVPGTGPGGRILASDLSAAPRRPDLPDLGTPGTRLPLRGLRRRSADRLARAARAVPQFTYVDECDLTELVRLRDSLREPFTRAGVKLTYLPFFLKAVAAALRDVPLVNASLAESGDEVLLHAGCHLGVAVATPAGLIVPVLRDADTSDLPDLARDLARLADGARAGRLRRDDLAGATFTVTSVAGVGGLFATPLVTPPQVGIAALGRIVRRPVYDSAGAVRPADMAYLSFSFDHRVIDGTVAATFANAVRDRLLSPARLLLPDLAPPAQPARSQPA